MTLETERLPPAAPGAGGRGHACQFHEVHTIRMDAPPARVFDAILRMRADEIALFNLLTWIRRGGQRLPEGILNAGSQKSLIDVATRTTFVRLAEDAPRELVVGTVIAAPPGARSSALRAAYCAISALIVVSSARSVLESLYL